LTSQVSQTCFKFFVFTSSLAPKLRVVIGKFRVVNPGELHTSPSNVQVMAKFHIFSTPCMVSAFSS
jgi:hypothetical protein